MRAGQVAAEEGRMLINRTTGSASMVPELVYPDVGQAADWLCETFGCTRCCA